MHDLSIGKLISLLFRYFQIYAAGEFEPYNIGRGQALFLAALYQQDGLSQEKLAASLNMDKSTTARALNKLERAGYVFRQKNKHDLRSKHIFLTPKAREFKPCFYSILQQWTEILSAGMSEEEVAAAIQLLTKMFHNAIEYIHKEKGKEEIKQNKEEIEAHVDEPTQ
jgi:DNA-binding MarR family transcriptional regulator